MLIVSYIILESFKCDMFMVFTTHIMLNDQLFMCYTLVNCCCNDLHFPHPLSFLPLEDRIDVKLTSEIDYTDILHNAD